MVSMTFYDLFCSTFVTFSNTSMAIVCVTFRLRRQKKKNEKPQTQWKSPWEKSDFFVIFWETIEIRLMR